MDQVSDLVLTIQKEDIKSVAVCLLFSFLHPDHEQQIASILRTAGFQVSLSSEILPEYREYERTSTTVVNAYVSPMLDRYLSGLEQSLDAKTSMRILQSNGGSISISEARKFGVRCILSGPAGGVVGCEYVANSSPTIDRLVTPMGDPGVRVITFDMGGTSTDVSLIDNKPQITTEAVVSGCPIRIPMLDIHTIGAGGGSIARVDAGGALLVGPESAGADPGPACYARNNNIKQLSPTVTDANVVLGRIQPQYFLPGQITLDVLLARKVYEQLGEQLHLTAEKAALGVVQVANSHMERALRVISLERGHDPRRFTLLSFGGAGGLHAAELARSLGIPNVLIPPLASTLSAFGMLIADVIKDYTRTVMLPGTTPIKLLSDCLHPLTVNGHQDLISENIPENKIRIEQFLDIRYQGQSYELIVPFSKRVFEDFHLQHKTRFGYANIDAPIEIVNLRVRAYGRTTPLPQSRSPSRDQIRLPPYFNPILWGSWRDGWILLFTMPESSNQATELQDLR